MLQRLSLLKVHNTWQQRQAIINKNSLAKANRDLLRGAEISSFALIKSAVVKMEPISTAQKISTKLVMLHPVANSLKEKESLECLNYLLNKGANPLLADLAGKTRIMLVLMVIVLKLLQKKIKILTTEGSKERINVLHPVNFGGKTPAHLAAEHHSKESLRILPNH